MLFRDAYSNLFNWLWLLGAEGEGSRGEIYPVGRGGDGVVNIAGCWIAPSVAKTAAQPAAA